MQADLPGEHSLQICIRISSSSTDSCNACDLSHLNKKNMGGKKKERGRVEGAEINQLSTSGGRKRSATTTTCLHPQWSKLVITHMERRGRHSIPYMVSTEGKSLLQEIHCNSSMRRERPGILPPESPGVWDTDLVLTPLTQTHLQQLASKWRHSYLCCSPSYCGFPFKKRPFTLDN